MNTKVLVLSFCSKEGKIKERWYAGCAKTEFYCTSYKEQKISGTKTHLWSTFLHQKHIYKLLLDILMIKNGIDYFPEISLLLITLVFFKKA